MSIKESCAPITKTPFDLKLLNFVQMYTVCMMYEVNTYNFGNGQGHKHFSIYMTFAVILVLETMLLLWIRLPDLVSVLDIDTFL